MSVRVVVVEDSATVRALLVAILETDPDIEVVAEAATGGDAVRLAKELKPDVMTMDLHMPGMNGVESIRRIMRESPLPIVVVSAVASEDVAASFEAMRAGAVTAIGKPGVDKANYMDAQRQLISTVKAMAEVKVVRRWRSHPPRQPTPSELRPLAVTRDDPFPPLLFAIAASTGGPAALHQLFGQLPAGLAVPVVVVQHIARGFLPGLVEWWSSGTQLHVKVAEDGERLLPGVIYVAPDAVHLGLRDHETVEVFNGPPIGGHRPAATFLFDSVARVCGPAAVALILTGMGSDGVDGLRAVRANGGHVIAQDEASSVVFGMPRAAIAAGVVDEVLPLSRIAPRLAVILGGGSRRQAQ